MCVFEGFFKMCCVALWLHYFAEFVMIWRVALWLVFWVALRCAACLGVSWRVFAFTRARKMRARCAQEARLLRKMRGA